MQVRSGSILIADPVHADSEHTKSIVLITESTEYSTLGLTLNCISHYNMSVLMKQHDVEWPYDNTVYTGGAYNPGSLIMLHSDDWYSSNTMYVDSGFSISSDMVMLEKLEVGNAPSWHKMYLGCEYWQPEQLEWELRKSNPKWLVLPYPSQVLIELTDPDDQWRAAVDEYSQELFRNYF